MLTPVQYFQISFRNGFLKSWIGLTDEGHEGKWTYVGTNTSAWYTNWRRTQPNNLGGVENCAVLLIPTGFWNDKRCFQKSPYICQRDGTSKVKELGTHLNDFLYCPVTPGWSLLLIQEAWKSRR